MALLAAILEQTEPSVAIIIFLKVTFPIQNPVYLFSFKKYNSIGAYKRKGNLNVKRRQLFNFRNPNFWEMLKQDRSVITGKSAIDSKLYFYI
ncbi:hypothetical protein SDC9_69567 [bioreactor metagenome]|uniref:Uncharacterized protein n=1 Tax=bioreactor metagenome TaxID=1076179 RepID=A0A644Y945_9ZZZZ